MLKKVRPSEFGLWAALWSIEPWGEDRADLRAGIIASVLANVNRDPKRKPEPFKAVDFMPYAYQPPTTSDLAKRLRTLLPSKPAKPKKKK